MGALGLLLLRLRLRRWRGNDECGRRQWQSRFDGMRSQLLFSSSLLLLSHLVPVARRCGRIAARAEDEVCRDGRSGGGGGGGHSHEGDDRCQRMVATCPRCLLLRVRARRAIKSRAVCASVSYPAAAAPPSLSDAAGVQTTVELELSTRSRPDSRQPASTRAATDATVRRRPVRMNEWRMNEIERRVNFVRGALDR